MIADQFGAFLFDLDGVVYLGEKPTPGAVEILDCLRERRDDTLSQTGAISAGGSVVE